jgi:hypothetical protein
MVVNIDQLLSILNERRDLTQAIIRGSIHRDH